MDGAQDCGTTFNIFCWSQQHAAPRALGRADILKNGAIKMFSDNIAAGSLS